MKSLKQKVKDGEISWGEYNNFNAKKRGYKNFVDYQNFLIRKRGYKDWNEYTRERSHITGKTQPALENKKCAHYLGDVAEKYLSKIFDNVTRMSYGNSGYDFICGKGFKIDVKSACIKLCSHSNSNTFSFRIRHNKIADYFLLLAFDNRKSLNPKHIWLIKNNEIIREKKFNEYDTFCITMSKTNDFKKYELNDKLEILINYCNTLKNKKENE